MSKYTKVSVLSQRVFIEAVWVLCQLRLVAGLLSAHISQHMYSFARLF